MKIPPLVVSLALALTTHAYAADSVDRSTKCTKCVTPPKPIGPSVTVPDLLALPDAELVIEIGDAGFLLPIQVEEQDGLRFDALLEGAALADLLESLGVSDLEPGDLYDVDIDGTVTPSGHFALVGHVESTKGDGELLIQSEFVHDHEVITTDGILSVQGPVADGTVDTFVTDPPW